MSDLFLGLDALFCEKRCIFFCHIKKNVVSLHSEKYFIVLFDLG